MSTSQLLTLDAEALQEMEGSLQMLRDQLLSERCPEGHWRGRLAASALSTATAVSALSVYRRNASASDQAKLSQVIERGLQWLDDAQNSDGGFGDTNRSPSNIASSYLALAAWHLGGDLDSRRDAIKRLREYIETSGGMDGLKQRYGRDKTFVVPILSNCAIAGLVPWSRVASLPFELAAFPQSMYRFLRMPVVSYAIPALVAIGQARFHHAGTWNPIAWLARYLSRGKTLRVLQRMQPESGGYLEATPLTSFVLMNLASMNHADHPVSQTCVKFLLSSQLGDGSWPIDEDLATWLTSLSINALSEDETFDLSQIESAVPWHLSCQHTQRHPFTGAEPGGWGWTDLSGAVPDADDTPAAMIALTTLSQRGIASGHHQDIDAARRLGVRWLLDLQNRDGGWPTFCRGWGKLPFDRSGSDLTAHCLRALSQCSGVSESLSQRIQQATQRGLEYLAKTQFRDGSWLPLWFGNHDCHDDENRVYGTGRVLLAYQQLGQTETSAYQRGLQYLVETQNADGGWGGGQSVSDWLGQQGLPDRNSYTDVPVVSSIEETAVALEALAGAGSQIPRATIIGGVRFLSDAVRSGRTQYAWPIGFYFAKLWYHERLYPLVFSTAAMGKALRTLRS